MKFITKHITLFISISMLFGACKKDEVQTPTANKWSWEKPSHFPEPHYQFDKLAYSEASFKLGKKLFFDPILSVDNSISCGSCHEPSKAFADNKTHSPGVNGNFSKRHTPALINLAWEKTFMWDGGINHLEIMPFAPITNPREMGEDMSNVVEKLNQHEEYKTLFESVFQKTPITDQQVLLALTIYMTGIISSNSNYDKFLQGDYAFNSQSSLGYQLFTKHCTSCHSEPLLATGDYKNNGLELISSDSGRYLITLDTHDLGKFKIPTLRNIELTAPYMHDGRFSSLSEVIQHYSNGIQHTPNLAEELPQSGFKFTEEEMQALEAFLKELTDYEFINSKKLAP